MRLRIRILRGPRKRPIEIETDQIDLKTSELRKMFEVESFLNEKLNGLRFHIDLID